MGPNAALRDLVRDRLGGATREDAMRFLHITSIVVSLMLVTNPSLATPDNWREIGPYGQFSTSNYPQCLRARPAEASFACLPQITGKSKKEKINAHEGRAIIYYYLFSFDKSRTELDAALKLTPKSASLLHLKARVALGEALNSGEQHAFATANAAINAAVALQPKNQNMLLTKATLQFIEGRPGTALATTLVVLKKNPTNAAAWVLAGQLFTAVGQAANAIDAYQHGLAHDDSLIEAHRPCAAIGSPLRRCDQT
jgi:tetratricopeptide (TPR) repeat protein